VEAGEPHSMRNPKGTHVPFHRDAMAVRKCWDTLEVRQGGSWRRYDQKLALSLALFAGSAGGQADDCHPRLARRKSGGAGVPHTVRGANLPRHGAAERRHAPKSLPGGRRSSPPAP
jgi:hypothetical protein